MSVSLYSHALKIALIGQRTLNQRKGISLMKRYFKLKRSVPWRIVIFEPKGRMFKAGRYQWWITRNTRQALIKQRNCRQCLSSNFPPINQHVSARTASYLPTQTVVYHCQQLYSCWDSISHLFCLIDLKTSQEIFSTNH